METGTAQVYPPEVAPTVVNATPPPKANSTSDLLDMLSLDGPNEIGEESSLVDDNSWANFQCMFSGILQIEMSNFFLLSIF